MGPFLKRTFSIDLRALGIFRVLLGAVLLFDLVFRYRFLSAHYTGIGILPGDAVLKNLLPAWNLCLHCHAEGLGSVSALFLLHCGLAFLLLIGAGGRVITVLNWLLLASLQQRNPLVEFEGDILLSMCLFWGMFLPLHERSVFGHSASAKRNAAFSVATVAYLSMLAALFWAGYWAKTGVGWSDGSAIFLGLFNDMMATPLAVDYRAFLAPYSWYLSKLVLALLFLCPLLWFSPFFPGRIRTASVFSLALLHLVFAYFFVLDLTPFVFLIALLPVLPEEFWDAILTSTNENLPPAELPLAELPSAELPEDAPSSLLQAFAGAAFAGMVVISVARWPGAETRFFPESIFRAAEALHLPKSPGFLEPEPSRDGGWYVIRGLTEAGVDVDALRGLLHAPVWKMPKYATRTYQSERWLRIYRNLWLKKYARNRFFLGRYLCDEWNVDQESGKRLESLEMFYNYSRPSFSYDAGRTQPIPIFRGSCALPEAAEEGARAASAN